MSYKEDSVKYIDAVTGRLDAALAWCKQRGSRQTPTPLTEDSNTSISPSPCASIKNSDSPPAHSKILNVSPRRA